MTSLKVNIIQLEEGISDNAIVYTHTPYPRGVAEDRHSAAE